MDKYGKCECEAPLTPVWFTEHEYRKGVKTGRKRTACSHLICEYVREKYPEILGTLDFALYSICENIRELGRACREALSQKINEQHESD